MHASSIAGFFAASWTVYWFERWKEDFKPERTLGQPRRAHRRRY